jgi:hypothetical protein
VRRSLAGWCLCALALATGVLTAGLAAANRARGDELDRLERWCEAQSRRNELARVANQRQEWRLLSGTSASASERALPRAGNGVAP